MVCWEMKATPMPAITACLMVSLLLISMPTRTLNRPLAEEVLHR